MRAPTEDVAVKRNIAESASCILHFDHETRLLCHVPDLTQGGPFVVAKAAQFESSGRFADNLSEQLSATDRGGLYGGIVGIQFVGPYRLHVRGGHDASRNRVQSSDGPI